MSLHDHYRKLYEESVPMILSDRYEVDDLIDSAADNRYGITLLLRPSLEVRENMQKFIEELKKIEPEQYYYPNSDIHVTVMSLISCYDSFDVDTIDSADYVALVRKCLAKLKNFNIVFKGITASTSGIMVQGFPDNTELNALRDRLRTAFKNSDLEQSIDKRYAIRTAHATVVRFRKRLKQKGKLLDFLDRNINYEFSTSKVDQFELVHNDWYQREKNVHQICKFKV